MLAVLLDPILPVFAILALGALSGRLGHVSRADAEAINRLAMNVLVPILVFNLMATAPLDTFSAAAVTVYFLAEAGLFAVVYLTLRRGFGLHPAEALLLGWASIFANNVYFGLPITLLLYGPEATLPVTSVVTLDSFVTMAAAMIALQALAEAEPRPLLVLNRIARIPILQALVAGLAFNLVALGLPAPLVTFVEFTGGAAAPVALFALGVVLSGTDFRLDRVVALVAAVKIAVFPLTVGLGLMLIALPEPDMTLYLLAAAGPSGATAINMALLYGAPSDRIAQAIVWTSLLSLFGLSLLAAFGAG